MEGKEHMNKVHHKVPVKSAEFLPGTNGKTEAKTSKNRAIGTKTYWTAQTKRKLTLPIKE